MGAQLKEVSFGLDNFGKPKMLSIKESIVQVIMNVLFMKPGCFPSMPWIGINIKSYLYMMEDEIDIDTLKSDIYEQCSAVIKYVEIDSVEAYFTSANGSAVLIINIPITISNNSFDCTIGFTKDSSDSNVKYNFQLEARKAS